MVRAARHSTLELTTHKISRQVETLQNEVDALRKESKLVRERLEVRTCIYDLACNLIRPSG